MADSWYVTVNGEQLGPLTPNQLKQMALSGAISPSDLLWKAGMPQWKRCDSIKGLFPLPSATTAAEPGNASRARPPRVGGRPPEAFGAPPRKVAPPPSVMPPRSGLAEVSVSTTGPSTSGLTPGGVPPLMTGTIPTGDVIGSSNLQLAEFMPRAGAALLDGLFLTIGCGIPAGLIIGVSAVAAVKADAPALFYVGQGLAQLVVLAVAASYFVFLECSEKQGSWGKQIVGIKVTDLEGQRITTGRAAGRFVAKLFLSNCTCGITLLLPLFSEKKQTLHDMVCGCLALRK